MTATYIYSTLQSRMQSEYKYTQNQRASYKFVQRKGKQNHKTKKVEHIVKINIYIKHENYYPFGTITLKQKYD